MSTPDTRIPPPAPAPVTKPALTLGTRLRRGFWFSLVLFALLAAAYTWFTLHWAYSEGERAGVLQKFSRKGWLCKTYEGEIALYLVGGLSPQIWHFTVRDAALAEQMHALVGQSVRLRYTEHVGVPTNCFGDTGYFVNAFVLSDVPPPHVVVPRSELQVPEPSPAQLPAVPTQLPAVPAQSPAVPAP